MELTITDYAFQEIVAEINITQLLLFRGLRVDNGDGIQLDASGNGMANAIITLNHAITLNGGCWINATAAYFCYSCQ